MQVVDNPERPIAPHHRLSRRLRHGQHFFDGRRAACHNKVCRKPPQLLPEAKTRKPSQPMMQPLDRHPSIGKRISQKAQRAVIGVRAAPLDHQRNARSLWV